MHLIAASVSELVTTDRLIRSSETMYKKQAMGTNQQNQQRVRSPVTTPSP